MRKLKRTFKSERWNRESRREIRILVTALMLIIAVFGPKITFSQSKVVDTENKEIVPPYYVQKPKTRVYEKPVDIGNDVAKYKGANFPINTGKKGGRFILYKGKPLYLKKIA